MSWWGNAQWLRHKLHRNRQQQMIQASGRRHPPAIIRWLDIFISLFGLLLSFPLLVIVLLISSLVQKGTPLFRQQRVGQGEQLFTLIKFRTMRPATDSVGTHEVDPEQITGWGSFLRKTKIDELPQLWNVLKGEMSLVGPRPCLPSQSELIAARKAIFLFSIRPGITGLAQIQGIDMSHPQLLVKTDAEMIRTMSVFSYCKYIILTICGAGFGDRVRGKRAGR